MRKLLIILFIIVFFFACGGSSKKSKSSVNVTDETVTPELPPTDPPVLEESIKILTFYDNNTVKWYSGSEMDYIVCAGITCLWHI